MSKKESRSTYFAKTRYFFLFAGIIFNLLLISFPNMLPEKITDRILIAFVLVTAIGVLLILEELKILIEKRQEDADRNFNDVKQALTEGDIYRSIVKIESQGDRLFFNKVIDNLNEFKAKLKRAENGELYLDKADTTVLALTLSTMVEKSLCATCLWDESPLFGAHLGEYLQNLSVSVRSRAVSVKRLFIIEPGQEDTEIFIARLNQEMDHGFEVRYIYKTDWMGFIDIKSPKDFGIWDESKLWVYNKDSGEFPKEQFASLHINKDEIESYKKVFESNWTIGHTQKNLA